MKVRPATVQLSAAEAVSITGAFMGPVYAGTREAGRCGMGLHRICTTAIRPLHPSPVDPVSHGPMMPAMQRSILIVDDDPHI
ncbi:MAG TPA: hypothetical protein PLF78_10590, partial [Caulobacter sp.]|nr:hypothetical protein [Caulobacter sp.]